MPILLLITAAFLIFAVTIELFALEYSPETLIALFLSLPVPQQIAWGIICFVPLALLAIAVLEHAKLIKNRKIAEALERRLHSIRVQLIGLERNQTENDQAAQYLNGSDPEGAVNALQRRVSKADQGLQFHQERNIIPDITRCMEQLRQKQQEIRHKLGEVIAKRRSMETSISQLQSSQQETENTLSVIEQDDTGESLERRLQKLSQFVATASTRSEEVERSMQDLLELEEKFGMLQRRLVPLQEKGIGLLSALCEVKDRFEVTISGLERDEGFSLPDRIQYLSKIKRELDERVSSIVTQFSEIEAIHRDMTGLFARLPHAHRIPREQKSVSRVDAINGNGADRRQVGDDEPAEPWRAVL